MGRGREILSWFPINPPQILLAGVLSPWQVDACCHHGRWMRATCGSTNADNQKSKSLVCQFQPKLGNSLALFKTGSQMGYWVWGQESTFFGEVVIGPAGSWAMG